MMGFDFQLALFFMERCLDAYKLYENNGYFDLPEGYEIVSTFKAKALNPEAFGTNAFKNEAWFGYIIESANNIIVAFRGSRSLSDWLNNIDFPQTTFPFIADEAKTHSGFTDIYSSCRDEIINTLQLLPFYKTLFITGHSLGAALATLHTLDAAANTKFKHPVMINFGSPRVGDPNFARAFNRRVSYSVRIANIYDIVPHLPFKKIKSPLIKKVWHYEHVDKYLPIAFRTGSVIGDHISKYYYMALKDIAADYYTTKTMKH